MLWCLPKAADATVGQLITWHIFCHVTNDHHLWACRHRGFETVTYVLPERAGLVHRDSIGTKMSYGDGAVQWMTAGRGMPREETNPNPHPNPHPNLNPDPNQGMLHEEMWDVSSANEQFELYQVVVVVVTS